VRDYIPTCPYCKSEDSDLLECLTSRADEPIEVFCGHCERKFFLSWEAVYNSNGDCELDKRTHELVQSKYKTNLFECKNCDHHIVTSG